MSLYQEIFEVPQMEFVFHNTKHYQMQHSCDCWKLFFPPYKYFENPRQRNNDF